jgi:serine/threonine protein kinase
MAPEVMLNRNHGFAADYFALGVIAYECMVGKRPYRGKHKNQIRDKMMAEQIKAEIQEPFEDYPQEAADFINKCILRDPKERLCTL